MGKYSIKELEQLSGIKAHTIRIWEKRHQLIEPQRTNTNIRFYSDEDLKKIINVSLLNSNGLKISKIAGMSADEMSKKIIELSETKPEASVHIDQLVIGMVELDEEKFEKILSGLVLRFGFEKTMVEVIYPFLEKIGILWQTHHINPAQEHFISNLIRQKVIVAIDSLPIPSRVAKGVMLFLPEHELHEISLLFSHYRFRKAGFRTYYLGQTVPLNDLKAAFQIHLPQTLITSITSPLTRNSRENYIEKLATSFPDSKILLAGYQVHDYQVKHPNINILKQVSDLDPFLIDADQ
jgi:MerR family transcriptional regulator, light-induced transcriptional regulator